MDFESPTYKKRQETKTLRSLAKEVKVTKLSVDIPEDLHREFKMVCSRKGEKIKVLIVKAVRKYVEADKAEQAREAAKLAQEREDRSKIK